jgi:DNA-binding NarL/FixJ family response regulator
LVTIPIVVIHGDDAARAALVVRFHGFDDLVVVASVRVAAAGVSALAQQPDAVVVIPQQPIETGRIKLVDVVRHSSPTARVVMLADSIDSVLASAATRSGVSALLRTNDASLVDAVRLVAAGLRVFDPAVGEVFVDVLNDSTPSPRSHQRRGRRPAVRLERDGQDPRRQRAAQVGRRWPDRGSRQGDQDRPAGASRWRKSLTQVVDARR